MEQRIPTIPLPEAFLRHVAISRRELDTVMVAAIVTLVSYLAMGLAGFAPSPGTAWALAAKYLGFSAPIFAAFMVYVLWVVGALIVEVAGLTKMPRRWAGVAAALFYLENVAPFVGLLECFISIVKALLAYAAAGVTAAAQSVLISNIAVALCASAVGCFVALCAHSLKAVLTHRGTRG